MTVSLFLANALATADEAPRNARVLNDAEDRIKAIYERREFAAKPFAGKWSSDSSIYWVAQPPKPGADLELVRFDVASGKRAVVLGDEQLVVPGSSERLFLQAFYPSPDGKRVILHTRTRSAEGDKSGYWVFDLEKSSLDVITADITWVASDNPFSPDGERFLFRQGADLCAYHFTDKSIVRLTSTEPGRDWENGLVAAWSPDGKRVAYVQSDSSLVRQRAVIQPTDPSYPRVAHERFARVGTPIPTLKVGVVDASGGETQWIKLPHEPGTFYLNDVDWAANSEEILIEWLSRSRDQRSFLIANASTGKVRTAYEESDPAWVDASYQANAGLEWISGGKEFVLLSERDGWRHAYRISRDGKAQTLLTKQASDIIARGPVDERGGWLYFIASPENATQRYLYRVPLDGTSEPQRVTPADQPGSHHYDFSPDRKWAIHSYSTFDSPPVVDLVRLSDHHSVCVLEDSSEVRQRVAPLISRPTEFVQLDIGDGVVMDAWMIKPRDFDPAKKYPVFVFVYGEPHGQTVLDDWTGGQNHTMFHRMIADIGYLVVSIDNRGTPAPKGAAWRRAVYASLGPLSTKEQAAGLKELGRTRPYVDLSRVGIWGWSGGGSNTLNAMFREPDVYHVGIAVAPKPQPDLYNAWFQEIFMRTKEANPEGYRQSAPIHFAEGLRGDLLIVHGTGETNTHIQITEGLVDRLIELGKRFDYMAYPNRDHGIREGKGTAVHLRMLMTRYLIEHLPPGPR